MPARSEVSDVINAQAAARGRVIDRLQPGDVVVVDLFGKIADGTFFGDNLHSAIYTGTRTGFVIDGSIRDLGGVIQLDAAGYFRGSTPTTYRNVLTGINIPTRIFHPVRPGAEDGLQSKSGRRLYG